MMIRRSMAQEQARVRFLLRKGISGQQKILSAGRWNFRHSNREYRYGFASKAEQQLVASSTTPIDDSSISDESSSSSPSAASSTSSSPFVLQNNKIDPLSLTQVYRYLKLELFSESELETAFDQIVHHRKTIGKPKTNNENNDDDDEIVMTLEDLEDFLLTRIKELDCDTLPTNQTTAIANLGLIQRQYAHHQANQIMSLLLEQKNKDDTNTTRMTNMNTITKQQFCNRLTYLASSIDFKLALPIASSMLLVGASVGIITPAMPFVIEQLQLTATEYGAVVSAFALAKLMGNIPAAIAVEQYGRKPFMVYSLAPALALAVSGIGMAGSFGELFACRLLAGAGVAALSTAGTLMTTDVSTTLNRASTLAPIMSAFAAGTALGPALGGIMVDSIGLQMTFYTVGASYMGLGVLNRYLLTETLPRSTMKFPWNSHNNSRLSGSNGESMETDDKKKVSSSTKTAIQDAVGQWMPLLRNSAIRNVMIMNGMYWVALAGSQMTLLPLLLTGADTTFQMTAFQVGQVYMGMSCIQFVGNPIFAKVSDTIGQAPAILGGCTLIGTSMAVLPMTETIPQLGVTLAIWASGSSMLSTAPVAYISDAVVVQQQQHKRQQENIDAASKSQQNAEDAIVEKGTEKNSNSVARAQAIALLRTCGDVGFLFGAASIGALADYMNSVETAMQCSSAMLLSATAWFATTRLSSVFAGETVVPDDVGIMPQQQPHQQEKEGGSSSSLVVSVTDENRSSTDQKKID